MAKRVLVETPDLLFRSKLAAAVTAAGGEVTRDPAACDLVVVDLGPPDGLLLMRPLPALGAAVSLRIRVGRWRCGTPACAGRVFAARLPGVAEVRGRRTCRANVVARLIGLPVSQGLELKIGADTLVQQGRAVGDGNEGRGGNQAGVGARQ